VTRLLFALYVGHSCPPGFHGVSIAGLVVGAMGVFVFSVALRHWLKERKAAMVQEAS